MNILQDYSGRKKANSAFPLFHCEAFSHVHALILFPNVKVISSWFRKLTLTKGLIVITKLKVTHKWSDLFYSSKTQQAQNSIHPESFHSSSSQQQNVLLFHGSFLSQDIRYQRNIRGAVISSYLCKWYHHYHFLRTDREDILWIHKSKQCSHLGFSDIRKQFSAEKLQIMER